MGEKESGKYSFGGIKMFLILTVLVVTWCSLQQPRELNIKMNLTLRDLGNLIFNET